MYLRLPPESLVDIVITEPAFVLLQYGVEPTIVTPGATWTRSIDYQ